MCLFVSISLLSPSFCLGFASPERDYGNWYVVSIGLFLLFYHSGRNGISRWCPYCQRHTRLQFCFPRGFVRFFFLVKAGCVRFWTDARANRWFFFPPHLVEETRGDRQLRELEIIAARGE